MPTYAFRCDECGRVAEPVMSISEYVRNPPALACCGALMQRYINVVPGLACHNALASERHYDGLTATDGTPIDTRAKHREYMRSRNLTTIDDYAETWKRQAQEREARMAGEDKTRAADVAQAILSLGG